MVGLFSILCTAQLSFWLNENTSPLFPVKRFFILSLVLWRENSLYSKLCMSVEVHQSDHAIKTPKVTTLKTIKAAAGGRGNLSPQGIHECEQLLAWNPFAQSILCAHEGSYSSCVLASGSQLQSESASPYTTLGGKPRPADGCAKNPFSAWSCCSCFEMYVGRAAPRIHRPATLGHFVAFSHFLQYVFSALTGCYPANWQVANGFSISQKWRLKKICSLEKHNYQLL